MGPNLLFPPSINNHFRFVPVLPFSCEPRRGKRRSDFGAHFLRIENRGAEQEQEQEEKKKSDIPLLTPYKMGPFDLSHR